MEYQKLNKREFAKLGLLGICGTCLLANGIPLETFGQFSTPDEDALHMREAMFYTPTAKGQKCLICPNNCVIKPGESGECHTRWNADGRLYTIAYGNPCAVHVDPIEKKPLYHFLPQSKAFSIATAGCNLACLNCQNWEISQANPRQTRNHDLLPGAVLKSCLENRCSSIAYTYSDPVAFYEYTYDTSQLARVEGIKNVLVSAGYINKEPLRELAKYIDAANIDLKSFSNEIYEMLNAGTLQPVLDTLKFLKDEGVWLEITNLVVPGWNDDLDMVKEMCTWLAENGFSDYPLHFSRFYPQHKLAQLPPTPTETLVACHDIAFSEGLKYVYIGNVPGADTQNTVCPGCGKVVVERKGFTVVQTNLTANACSFCKTEIAGIWN